MEKAPEHGVNPRYDKIALRESLIKKAHYTYVEKTMLYEKKAETMRQQLTRFRAEELVAQLKFEEVRAERRDLERKIKVADDGFRKQRREDNARLQAEAQARGEKTYATGTPCRNGHLTYRYTSSGACAECDAIGWDNAGKKQVKLLPEQST